MDGLNNAVDLERVLHREVAADQQLFDRGNMLREPHQPRCQTEVLEKNRLQIFVPVQKLAANLREALFCLVVWQVLDLLHKAREVRRRASHERQRDNAFVIAFKFDRERSKVDSIGMLRGRLTN